MHITITVLPLFCKLADALRGVCSLRGWCVSHAFIWTAETGKYDPDKKWCVPDLQVGRHSFGISLNDSYSISNQLRAVGGWKKCSFSVTLFPHTGSTHIENIFFLFLFLATRFTLFAKLRLTPLQSSTSSTMFNQCEWVQCDAGGLLVLISMCEKLVWRFTTHFPHISSSHGVLSWEFAFSVV